MEGGSCVDPKPVNGVGKDGDSKEKAEQLKEKANKCFKGLTLVLYVIYFLQC